MSSNDDEKKGLDSISPTRSIAAGEVHPAKGSDDDFEVFKAQTDGVHFRTVGWIHASVIFLKSTFRFPQHSQARRTPSNDPQ